MKNKKLIFFAIAIILILGLIGITYNIKNRLDQKNESYYDKAIEHLKTIDDDPNKNREDYQYITSYKGFGTNKNGDYRYVYMWILEESFYVKNGKLYSSSGSVMPYKFTFKDDEVIRYEIPKDGNEYESSIKELFPKGISETILNYEYYKYLNPQNEKKRIDHYSYLNSTEINFEEMSGSYSN